MQVDAIVNTASPQPVIGYGVDAGVHQKAGPALLAARRRIGRIPVGGAAITPGFALKAKYVIHAVGPVWQGGSCREEALLASCYEKSLALAKSRGCESVAFPLIGAGNHGFPKPLALQVALRTISAFLMKQELQVYLVVFSRDAFRLSEQLFAGVSSYIDENYVLETNLQQYGLADKCAVRGKEQELILREQMRRREAQRAADVMESMRPMPSAQAPCAAQPAPQRRAKKPLLPFGGKEPVSLAQLMEQTDAGFSETLLKLIDRTGKKDSAVYSRANVSRQHFSKIRNNPDYKPTKSTAIAFAIALELDLDQTRDLIGRAGYALTNSSKFDLIIMYFISRRNYDLYEINAALFEFDQPLLGA